MKRGSSSIPSKEAVGAWLDCREFDRPRRIICVWHDYRIVYQLFVIGTATS